MKLARLLLPLILSTGSCAHANQGRQPGQRLHRLHDLVAARQRIGQNFTPGNGFTYSNLVLTSPGPGGQGGAGFAPTALMLDFNQAFSFDFHFFIPVSQDLRGDGLTFTLSDATGVGNAGSGLGYEALSPASVAFAIDTFHFDGEPVSPSLQILAGGSVTPLAFTRNRPGRRHPRPRLPVVCLGAVHALGQRRQRRHADGQHHPPQPGQLQRQRRGQLRPAWPGRRAGVLRLHGGQWRGQRRALHHQRGAGARAGQLGP